MRARNGPEMILTSKLPYTTLSTDEIEARCTAWMSHDESWQPGDRRPESGMPDRKKKGSTDTDTALFVQHHGDSGPAARTRKDARSAA